MSNNFNLNSNFFNRFIKANHVYSTGIDANGKEMNKNTFNKAEQNAIDLSDEFALACSELAQSLYLRYNDPERFDGVEFLSEYYPKVKNGTYTLKRAMEKYVLDVVYGKNTMNNKMRTKYNGSPNAKLNRLLKISAYISNPSNWRGGHFNWANINDPDYYDMRAAENRSNINWYTNSLNGRIANYRRKASKA
jgi:hypothetical protein